MGLGAKASTKSHEPGTATFRKRQDFGGFTLGLLVPADALSLVSEKGAGFRVYTSTRTPRSPAESGAPAAKRHAGADFRWLQGRAAWMFLAVLSFVVLFVVGFEFHGLGSVLFFVLSAPTAGF